MHDASYWNEVVLFENSPRTRSYVEYVLHSNGASPVQIAAMQASLKPVEFGKPDEARDDHGRWITSPESAVPPAPGTSPIPEGHFRLYHYTQPTPEEQKQRDSGEITDSDLEHRMAMRLKKEGMGIEHAKGSTYGEPNAVWASFQKPHDFKVYSEFHVPWDDPRLFIGKPSSKADAERMMKSNNDVAFRDSIKPEEIVAVHEPWHHHYRYLAETPDIHADALNGGFDHLLNDSEYGPAVARFKHDFKDKKASFSASAPREPNPFRDAIATAFAMCRDEQPYGWIPVENFPLLGMHGAAEVEGLVTYSKDERYVTEGAAFVRPHAKFDYPRPVEFVHDVSGQERDAHGRWTTGGNWLQTLTPEQKEKTFESMRELRDKSDMHLKRSQDMSPKSGEIAAGSEHVREFARGEGLARYLGALGKGKNPDEALEEGKKAAADVATTWNGKREYQVHINPEMAGKFVEDNHDNFVRDLKEKGITPATVGKSNAPELKNADDLAEHLGEKFGTGRWSYRPDLLREAYEKKLAFRTTQEGGSGMAHMGQIQFETPPSRDLAAAVADQVHGHHVENGPESWTTTANTATAHEGTARWVSSLVNAGAYVAQHDLDKKFPTVSDAPSAHGRYGQQPTNTGVPVARRDLQTPNYSKEAMDATSLAGKPVARYAHEWWSGLSNQERAKLLVDRAGTRDLSDAMHRTAMRSYNQSPNFKHVIDELHADAREGKLPSQQTMSTDPGRPAALDSRIQRLTEENSRLQNPPPVNTDEAWLRRGQKIDANQKLIDDAKSERAKYGDTYQNLLDTKHQLQEAATALADKQRREGQAPSNPPLATPVIPPAMPHGNRDWKKLEKEYTESQFQKMRDKLIAHVKADRSFVDQVSHLAKRFETDAKMKPEAARARAALETYQSDRSNEIARSRLIPGQDRGASSGHNVNKDDEKQAWEEAWKIAHAPDAPKPIDKVGENVRHYWGQYAAEAANANRIRSLDDVNVGDRVHSILHDQYGTILRKNKSGSVRLKLEDTNQQVTAKIASIQRHKGDVVSLADEYEKIKKGDTDFGKLDSWISTLGKRGKGEISEALKKYGYPTGTKKAMIDHLKDNIKSLWLSREQAKEISQPSPVAATRNMDAKKLTKQLAEKHGISHDAASMLAAAHKEVGIDTDETMRIAHGAAKVSGDSKPELRHVMEAISYAQHPHQAAVSPDYQARKDAVMKAAPHPLSHEILTHVNNPPIKGPVTDRKLSNRIQKLDETVHQKAVEKATRDNNDYMQTMLGGMKTHGKVKLQKADRDLLHSYLGLEASFSSVESAWDYLQTEIIGE